VEPSVTSNPEPEGPLPPSEGPRPVAVVDRLAFAALAYLLLPVFLFLAGWCRPLWGLPSLLLLGWGFRQLRKGLPEGGGPAWKARTFLVPVLLAAAWAAAGGAGHLLYANKFDWFVRDAVLLDLTRTGWPVGYASQGQLLLLRCPLGYFLPSALLAKLTSVRLADAFLYLWTVLGVTLLLALVTDRIERTGRKVLFGAVVVLFSGMDLLGWVMIRDGLPHLGQHLEWWGKFFQYSSSTTLLFWVPNHALPGWLGAALLWRHRRDPGLAGFLPYLALATPFWSPFALIGLLPFLLAVLVPWLLRRQLGAAPWLHLLWTAGPMVLVGSYLAASASAIPGASSAGALWDDPLFLVLFVLFHVLEWFVVWVLLRRHYRKAGLLQVAGVCLLLLPLVRFGPSNDLVMRASVPALFLLSLWLGEALVLDAGFPVRSRRALLALFLVGCATPLEEFARSLVRPRWSPDLDRSLQDAFQDRMPPHYTVPAAVLSRTLRPPRLAPRSATPVAAPPRSIDTE
jgi:hypothetical protein